MRFENLNEIISKNEIITQDNLLQKVINFKGLYFSKRDYVFRSGTWRGNKKKALVSQLINRDRSKVALLTHSDLSTTYFQLQALRILGVKKVFGVNVHPYQDLSTPVPIGLTNNCDDSNLHRLFGNIHLLEKANGVNFSYKFNHSIYCNFTIGNNEPERILLLKTLSKLKNFNYSHPEFTPIARINYLESLRIFNLIPCPAGNGIDTHRLWETLYMGGIPVIKSNKLLNFLVKDLPVIIVKSWDELLDGNKMEVMWYKAVLNIEHEMNKLKLSYWTEKIKSNLQ